MSLARLNIPGLVLYGGSIAPGKFEGHPVTIQDVYEAIGAHARGSMDDARLYSLETLRARGQVRCGDSSQRTPWRWSASSWGLRRWGFRACPQQTAERRPQANARRTRDGSAAQRCHTVEILTKTAIENAIAGVAATGGSTNAVLHLLAIANEAKVPLSIDDFDRVSAKTPILADLNRDASSRRTCMPRAGPHSSRKRMIEAGLLKGEALTVSGKTLEKKRLPPRKPQARKLCAKKKIPQTNRWTGDSERQSRTGGLRNKSRGSQYAEFRGPARVFESEEAAFAAIEKNQIKTGT